MRKVYLIGRSGVYANARIEVDGEVVMGRNSQVCQLVYPPETKMISGVHCKFQCINGNFCIIDMNSTNGTFFEDGTRLQPNMPRMMRDGQGFYLGNRDNFFDVHIEEIQESKHFGKGNNTENQRLGDKEQKNKEQKNPNVVIYQDKKSSAGTVILVIILILAILAAAVFGMSYYQEQSKSPVEKTHDAFDAWKDEFDW